MPSLDNASLAFAVFLVAATMGVAKAMAGFKQPVTKGTGHWAAGSLTLGLGFLLLGVYDRNLLPVMEVIANVLITLGLVLIARGVYRFLDEPPRHWLHLGALGLAGALLLYYLVLDPESRAWGLGSLALAPLILGDMALALARTRNHRISPIARFTAFVFALMALGSLLWGVYAMTLGETPAEVAGSAFTTVIYSLDIMVLVAGSLGLMLMSSGRLEAELVMRNDELEAEVMARKLTEDYMAMQAGQDFLTGLANRRKFFEEARKALGAARRHGRDLAVIMFDLDHFKQVNDKYGHLAGDEALKALALACQDRMRSEDTLARFGGEEFILLLPETDLGEAAKIAERLRRMVAGMPVRLRDKPVALHASFGVSALDRTDVDMEALVARADQALYCAKGLGRDRTCLHPGPGAEPRPVAGEQDQSSLRASA